MLSMTRRALAQQVLAIGPRHQLPAIGSRAFSSEHKSGSPKMWGGRFTKDTDKRLKAWTQSVDCDNHIVREDIWGSLAHVTMLGHQEIIPVKSATALVCELKTLLEQYEAGTWKLGFQQEDVHMNIEALMIERLGMDNGGRMHTCRSRNDQVCLDSKLYCRKRLLELRMYVCMAVDAFIDQAAKPEHLTAVMPSYTHFQHAQPISVSFWMGHYAAGLLRDLTRLEAAYRTCDENVLGAGAIAGSSFPVDRFLTASLMGFEKVMPNGLDATSARDFTLEACTAAATMYTHTLTRLAEELIVWGSKEYETITMDDGYAMGSSMMPQKKNPGMLELMRGRSGRVIGMMQGAFTMIKGLPSGYNRDFHEDKEIVITMFDITNLAVETVPGLIETTIFNLDRMKYLAGANFAQATEVANYLVREHNVPFRQTHHIVGALVGEMVRTKQVFSKDNLDVCVKIMKEGGVETTEEDLWKVVDPQQVMEAYEAFGSTGPKSCQDMVDAMRNKLGQHKAVLKADQDRLDVAHAACLSIATDLKGVTDIAAYRAVVAKHKPTHKVVSSYD